MPTMEEMRKYTEKYEKERKEREQRAYEARRTELEKKGIKPFDRSTTPVRRHDHPNTMEDSTATLLWIVVMIVGSIFKGNWMIWIVATAIWLKFITRYKK